MNRTLIALGSTLLLAPTLQAAELQSALRYETLNLANSSWLLDAQAGRSSDSRAEIDVIDLPPIPLGNSMLFHSTYMHGGSFAQANGRLGAELSLAAGGQLSTHAIWRDSFSNQSGATQAYVLDFALGSLSANLGGWSADHSQRDFRASFSLDILVNGSTVLQGSQTVIWSQGQLSLLKTGTDFGQGTLSAPDDLGDTAYYALAPFLGQVALGSFAAGRSFEVEYRLQASAYWNDPEGCAYECGGIWLGVGDPFAENGGGLQVSAVPEPANAALLLAGLGLVGWSLRRRQRAPR